MPNYGRAQSPYWSWCTGLHYLLLKLGYVYGDEKCLEFLDRLFATFRNEAYRASIELAKEKGSFPAFDIDRYSEEDFFKQLPTRIQNAIKKYGIRNAVMLTIAPCGSTSMILGVSSGVEPIFAPVYKRRFRDGNILREEYIVDSLFAEYYATGKDMKHFRGAYDITVEQHVAVQSTVQKYIDSAISKTINLPNDFSTDGLSDMMLEYAPYLKGCTIYRAGSKGDEPLESIINTAIGLEKDSIVFYLGIRKLVPKAMGIDKIDDIIREEMSHVAILSGWLKS